MIISQSISKYDYLDQKPKNAEIYPILRICWRQSAFCGIAQNFIFDSKFTLVNFGLFAKKRFFWKKPNFIKNWAILSKQKIDHFPFFENRSQQSAMVARSSWRLAVKWHARICLYHSPKCVPSADDSWKWEFENVPKKLIVPKFKIFLIFKLISKFIEKY